MEDDSVTTKTARKEDMETKFRQWTDMIVTPPPSTSTSSSTTSTPPSTLDFKIEAKQYFHSTVIMSSTNSSIENVSYEAAMASLLQTLQPCFAVSTTTTTKHIYLALSCIVGALQALTPTNETTSTATATTSSLSLSSDSPATVLSVPLVQLWSTFLLTYMGPITLPYDHNDAAETHEMDSSSNDYDIEQIRDVAMEGLTALITHCGTNSTNTGTSLHEWIPFLCSISQQGVERRCAIESDPTTTNNETDAMDDSDDDDDDKKDIYGFPQPQHHQPGSTATATGTIEYGLALLPRSRRTLCFTLLQQTVSSIIHCLDNHFSKSGSNHLNPPTPTSMAATKSTILQLIQFTTSCLHGESDPRCLLQLLQLFATMLQHFFPFIKSNGQDNHETDEWATQVIHYFFDAVVPYYPIQFQPPPDNNIYGITRLSLRQAVMRILSCTMYDRCRSQETTTGIATYVGNFARHDNDDTSMSSLTCQLLLDCLLPSPNDEPLTYLEQSEILEDFEQFLFTKAQTTNARGDNFGTAINLETLSVTHQKATANALIVIHEKSSLDVSRNSNGSNSSTKPIVKDAKRLADSCRSLITKIAIVTERIPFHNHTDMIHPWYTMVEEPVQQLSRRMLDDRADMRITIAYIACVTASGGYKTLNLCLECGLTPLFENEKVATNKAVMYHNDERLISTIYGIGAFFASSRVALNTALRDGIHWYPHPLSRYSADALKLILSYLIIDPGECDATESTQQVQVAAIRALESILLVSPTSALGSEDIDELVTGLSSLSSSTSMTEEGLQIAYSETFGTLLGMVLDLQADTAFSDDAAASNQVLIHSVQLRQYFMESLLPALLKSVQGKAPHQHDRRLLAKAAAFSFNAASYIMQILTKALHIAIATESDYVEAKSIAVLMSFLFEQENQFVAEAYQQLSPPNVTPDDILSTLVPTNTEQSGNMEALFGISTLLLPTSIEDRRKNSVVLEKIYSIILPLRRGYEHELSTTRLTKIVDSISKVLPPLSDMDTLRLSVILPLLAVALENARSPSSNATADSDDTKLQALLHDMIGDLADFTMVPENHSIARVHAARCLHAVIVRFVPHNNTLGCPVENLAKNNLFPVIHQGMSTLTEKSIQSHQKETAASTCIDALNVLAMLCSAAAIRGGLSSKSSDKIILFLVDLACKKKSVSIFSEKREDMIDLSAFDSSTDGKESSRIAVTVAALIGSILTTECRGSGLWRQRLIHIIVKRILESGSHISGTSQPDIHYSMGAVTSLCHVLCSANITAALSADQCFVVGTMLSQSLSSTEMHIDGPLTLKLILATILKMICTAPSCFQSVYPLVTGTLRAYATVDESPDGIICKILALQVLSAVAQMGDTDFRFLETVKAVRPAVLSLLGIATDHPLSALRSAAVEVRNNWHITS